MRKLLLAGNWKMHKKPSEVAAFFNEYAEKANLTSDHVPESVDLLFAVPYLCLGEALKLGKKLGFEVAAQNVHQLPRGAYTGEVSAEMLIDADIRTTLVGHSERRQYFAETNEIVAEKVKTCVDFGLRPILCVGETKEERERGQTEFVLKKQMQSVFDKLEEWSDIVVAYEPVWAIGTGLTATTAQAQEAHQYIRGLIDVAFGREAADQTRILYGGSVKPDNAKALFEQEDIDGGLVGGASLKPEDFAALTTTARQVVSRS
ncbi:MAG: triose-phosphate isomerase [Oligoflexus sp.]